MSIAPASMCWSTSQIETTSPGATWRSRHKSLLPYQPAPISPTRLGLPLTRSSASAPSAGNAAKAASAEPDLRKRRRLMLKGALKAAAAVNDFMRQVLTARDDERNLRAVISKLRLPFEAWFWNRIFRSEERRVGKEGRS